MMPTQMRSCMVLLQQGAGHGTWHESSAAYRIGAGRILIRENEMPPRIVFSYDLVDFGSAAQRMTGLSRVDPPTPAPGIR